MLLRALLLFHVCQGPDYLLNILSNFCSSNSAHAAIAVLLAVNCSLAKWKLPSLLLPEPVNSQNRDSRAVIPWLLPVLAPAHIQGAHPAAAQGTAGVFQPAGLPQHCAHPKKNPSDKTNPTKPCLWSQGVLLPATALLPLERRHQVRSKEQSNHNKGMKGRVQGKTRVANLKETTEIK